MSTKAMQTFLRLLLLCLCTPMLNHCTQNDYRARQLIVFDRNLQSIKKKTPNNDLLITSQLEEERICKKALAIAEDLNADQMTGDPRLKTIYWRYHLIDALLDLQRNTELTSPNKQNHVQILLLLGSKQLAELESPKYNNLQTLESGPCYEQLGELFYSCGKLNLAETCTKKSMQIFGEAFGNESRFLVWILSNLISINESQGKVSDAETACRKLIKTYKELPNYDPAMHAGQYYKHGELLQKLNKPADAELAFKQAASIFDPLSNAAHADSVRMHDALSYLLAKTLPPTIRSLAPQLLGFYDSNKVSSVRTITAFNLKPYIWRLDLSTNERLTPANTRTSETPDQQPVLIYADVLRECLGRMNKERARKLFPWADQAFDNDLIMKVDREQLPRNFLPGTKLAGKILVVVQIVAIPKKDWVTLTHESGIAKTELKKLWSFSDEDYVMGLRLPQNPPD